MPEFPLDDPESHPVFKFSPDATQFRPVHDFPPGDIEFHPIPISPDPDLTMVSTYFTGYSSILAHCINSTDF